MLVANSFDLWQRDAFFSAAEEVQESADILESAYRRWLRERGEGISASDLQELQREVQTALGTAKWQLEEFEKAVQLSYGNCRDHNRMARHQQFVVAIESQIARVEHSLRESLNEEGKEPLRWVNLDEDERDDLAMFLSGSYGAFTKFTRDESPKSIISTDMENLYKRKDIDYGACSSSGSVEASVQTKGLTSLNNDVVINIGPSTCGTEYSAREALGMRGDITCEADKTSSTKRTRVSPNSGTLRVIIPNEDDQMGLLMPSVEDTPKEKGFRASSCLQLRGLSCINKLFKRSSGFSVRIHPRRLQFSSSMRLIIVLMLSFILLVPYFIHSS